MSKKITMGGFAKVILNRPTIRDDKGNVMLGVPRKYQIEIRVGGKVFVSVWYYGDDETARRDAEQIAGELDASLDLGEQ